MKTLGQIGEDALIERLIALVPLPDHAAEGPGDDCAVIDPDPDSTTLQLLKTDALVAGIHFLPDADPVAVGWKAVARVVSDFAAMGGKPERFLITVALPVETEVEWVEKLYAGIGRCLRAFDAVLAGGETSRVPQGSSPVISVAATGSVKRDQVVLRSTGKPGDVVMVTGRLGGSLRGKHLHFTPRIREAEWLVSHYRLTAMMDVSDGLAKDLPRLAAASGCGYCLDRELLPVTDGCTTEEALADGEDFELLFSVRSGDAATLLLEWPKAFPELELTMIGALLALGEGDHLTGGWDHFGRA